MADKLKIAVGTLGGAGFLPAAPGTYAAGALNSSVLNFLRLSSSHGMES
jgi:hypothetical protein